MMSEETAEMDWCVNCIYWTQWAKDDLRNQFHVMACGDCANFKETRDWTYYDEFCDWFEANEERYLD